MNLVYYFCKEDWEQMSLAYACKHINKMSQKWRRENMYKFESNDKNNVE